MDFYGVKVGDVNDSATPNLTQIIADTRTQETLSLSAENQLVRVGETIDLQLTSTELMNIQGVQFTLNYDADALEFVDVESVAMNNFSDENFAVFENEGALTLSWNGEFSINEKDPVFHFSFKAKEEGEVSNWLSINSRFTKSEIYSAANEILNVDLNFIDNNEIVDNSEMKLYQNMPNPFSDYTTIGFELPDASQVQLSIFDLSGKVIKTIQTDFEKGYQEIRIDATTFSSKGIYYYQLKSEFGTATQKMFFVK